MIGGKLIPLVRDKYEVFCLPADSFLTFVVEGRCFFYDFCWDALDVGVAGKVVVLEPVADKLLVVACGACSHFVFCCVPEAA